jgi:CDP-glucose 4,6-dehydratase
MKKYFEGRTVVITRHTGFKGSWLTAWLRSLGANVVGIALDPSTNPSHFISANLSEGIIDHRLDICNKNDLKEAILSAKPDFVFHLAAQALVGQAYDDPVGTWQTNLIGTINVLEALRNLNKACAAVLITSDKCYDNVEWVWGYRETDAIGGPDPYSASKGAAELAIRSYIQSYFPKSTSQIRIASARAGNVIGGGDWSSSRIVPDCVTAWSKNDIVDLRNPQSTRPWQHVLEPLSGYLTLAIALTTQLEFHGESFNFGPQAQQNHSVLDLVQQMAKYWNQVRWQTMIESNAHYESRLLKLNCDKALYYLKWYAVMGFEDTVRMTAEWYRDYYLDSNQIANITNIQISAYVKRAKEYGLEWAQ